MASGAGWQAGAMFLTGPTQAPSLQGVEDLQARPRQRPISHGQGACMRRLRDRPLTMYALLTGGLLNLLCCPFNTIAHLPGLFQQ